MATRVLRDGTTATTPWLGLAHHRDSLPWGREHIMIQFMDLSTQNPAGSSASRGRATTDHLAGAGSYGNQSTADTGHAGVSSSGSWSTADCHAGSVSSRKRSTADTGHVWNGLSRSRSTANRRVGSCFLWQILVILGTVPLGAGLPQTVLLGLVPIGTGVLQTRLLLGLVLHPGEELSQSTSVSLGPYPMRVSLPRTQVQLGPAPPGIGLPWVLLGLPPSGRKLPWTRSPVLLGLCLPGFQATTDNQTGTVSTGNWTPVDLLDLQLSWDPRCLDSA